MHKNLEQKLNPTICRRMLLAFLLETIPRPNNLALEQATGWPRRTIQDLIAKGLPGHGTEVEFVQQGVRHNDGYYLLKNWGSFDREWVLAHLSSICHTLGLEPPSDALSSLADD